MASNAEMLRLVEHAAEKLAVEREELEAKVLASTAIGPIAAMSYAEAILGMIASCLMPDDDPVVNTDGD